MDERNWWMVVGLGVDYQLNHLLSKLGDGTAKGVTRIT
jgi:hypothetical protein